MLATALGFLLPLTAPAAPPSLGLTATDALVGGKIKATAELSEGATATGEISFEVYGPGDPTCSGPALTPAPDPASVAGEGQYESGEFEPPTAGVYHWSAHYSGDGENSAADATCAASSTVGKASPGLTGSASAGVVGGTIHDDATLTGGFSPGGEVTFSVYAPTDTSCTTPLATTSAPIQDGDASSANFLPQQAGGFRWTADYPGDANNEAVSTTCGAANQTSVVSKASPALSGEATASVKVGTSITDSATLSGGFGASGQLVFRAYGPGDASCATIPKYEATVAVSGNGSYSPAGFAPAPGLYHWTVEYAGDANNEAVSTVCGVANQSSTVSKASPTLSGVATSVKVGLSITDSATLASGFSAGGQLVFRAYGPGDASCANTPAYEEAVAVNGNGPYAPTGFAPGPGSYRWTVEYAGDASNETVSTACGAANQDSVVSKASPTLTGVAISAKVGLSITDSVTLSGGFGASGQLVFRAYGPGDETCATTPKYEATVAVNGNGSYSPAGFAPAPGLYHWTVEYAGDANNAPASTACGAANQASAVGTISLSLTASASGGTVGEPVKATASIEQGAIPAGEITFEAFPPGDVNCAGAAAFRSTIPVAGNGPYSSGALLPTRVGTYRWTVAYSGDVNHAPAAVGCGQATSSVSPAKPSIAGTVTQRLKVGVAFRDTAMLRGGYAPAGTITFRIYGPVASGCAKPLFVNTVAVSGNGAFSSDPFVALRPGRYSFVASYSGDARNQATSEPCDSVGQAALVEKREPKVKPRARLVGPKLISIRAHLSGGASPSGVINFRLYGPGNKRCKGKPAFSGGTTVKSNGTYSLAEYLATVPGTYRLSVGYSGDGRNQRYKSSCGSAQPIRVG